MHRETFALLVNACVTLALTTGVATTRAQTLVSGENPRPNVVFIFVDDQGYYDLGCYGGKEFQTPRIDRMANEGVRFTDYYAAAPICSPSRAGATPPASAWQPGFTAPTRAAGFTPTN